MCLKIRTTRKRNKAKLYFFVLRILVGQLKTHANAVDRIIRISIFIQTATSFESQLENWVE